MQVLKLSDNYSEILSTPRREFRYTNVTNADGSRKTRQSRPSSARNAEILLMTETSKHKNIPPVRLQSEATFLCNLW